MGGESAGGGLGWLAWALAAAALSGLMSILTKAGLKDVDQGAGLAVQAPCIALFAWAVLLARGKVGELADIDGRKWAFLLGGGSPSAWRTPACSGR